MTYVTASQCRDERRRWYWRIRYSGIHGGRVGRGKVVDACRHGFALTLCGQVRNAVERVCTAPGLALLSDLSIDGDAHIRACSRAWTARLKMSASTSSILARKLQGQANRSCLKCQRQPFTCRTCRLGNRCAEIFIALLQPCQISQSCGVRSCAAMHQCKLMYIDA